MKKKHVLQLVLLPVIALLFAIFGIGCTNQLDNEQYYESFLYERDFPNFVDTWDRTVTFDHDELLDTFNFITDYWEANPYCDIRNAIVVLSLCVPSNRVRVALDSGSEELKVAFRTHVLDSRVIALEDVRRGMPTTLVWRIYSRTIDFGIESNRPNRAQLYNDQQECFTFAELLDTLTLVADFMRASRFTGQGREITNATSSFHLCVINNRVIVRLRNYSEELKEDFRVKVTDSPAVLFEESWQR